MDHVERRCVSLSDRRPSGADRWWGGRCLVTRISLNTLNWSTSPKKEGETEAKYYIHFIFIVTTFYCYNKKIGFGL